MCRSKSDGGRRCARTPYKKSRANLLRREDTAALNALTSARDIYGDDVRYLSMSLPPATTQLLDDLQDIGQPLIVGGSVRDACLGVTDPKDVDIEMHGTTGYKALARGLRNHGYQMNEVGKAFGVLKTTLSDGTDIDISLPRKDNRVGSGHRGFEVEVDPNMTLSEAAARRDFTINAMGYDHSVRALVDPHSGYDDLRNKVLRRVSSAYSEDPLRVLRGVQICSRFGLTMDSDTVQASREMVGEFAALPNERIQEEWTKFFKRGQDYERGLEVLQQTGWDTPMGLQGTTDSAGRLTRVVKEAKKQNLDPSVLGAASLLSQINEEKRAEVSQRLISGSRNQNMATRLANVQEDAPTSDSEVRSLARRLDKDSLAVQSWALLDERPDVARLAQKNNCYEGPVKDLLTGGDLLAQSGRSAGRWVGEALRELRRQQDSGVVSSRDEAVQWLSEYLNPVG